MKKKTAQLIKENLDGFTGHASLYKVNPAMKDDEGKKCIYVVCSSAVVRFSGIETYIFASDKDGNVINWIELNGSQRGTLSHAVVLDNAGYEII